MYMSNEEWLDKGHWQRRWLCKYLWNINDSFTSTLHVYIDNIFMFTWLHMISWKHSNGRLPSFTHKAWIIECYCYQALPSHGMNQNAALFPGFFITSLESTRSIFSYSFLTMVGSTASIVCKCFFKTVGSTWGIIFKLFLPEYWINLRYCFPVLSSHGFGQLVV